MTPVDRAEIEIAALGRALARMSPRASGRAAVYDEIKSIRTASMKAALTASRDRAEEDRPDADLCRGSFAAHSDPDAHREIGL